MQIYFSYKNLCNLPISEILKIQTASKTLKRFQVNIKNRLK